LRFLGKPPAEVFYPLLVKQSLYQFKKIPKAGRYLGFGLEKAGYSLVQRIVVDLILYERNIGQKLIYKFEGMFDIVRICLLISSVLIYLMGAMSYDMFQFLGTRQIDSNTITTLFLFNNSFTFLGKRMR